MASGALYCNVSFCGADLLARVRILLKCGRKTTPMNSPYNGPIFVTDIDETLRNNHTTPRTVIPGALEILTKVAEMGVPIVYLTAASVQWRTYNIHFLYAFPQGLLLDRPENDTRPNMYYKQHWLQEIRIAYPNATLVCMGDNETHDALAYQLCGGGSFVRKVREWTEANSPNIDSNAMLSYTEYSDHVKKEIFAILEKLRPIATGIGPIYIEGHGVLVGHAPFVP